MNFTKQIDMRWLNRILKVIILTIILGVVYSIINYIISPPPKPNMYLEGVIFTVCLYSIINILFMIIAYITTRVIDKKMCNVIFQLKYLLLEIIFLYILFAISSYIPYNFNILPVNKSTENDLFQTFTPFIILYIIWVIVIIVRRNPVLPECAVRKDSSFRNC